MDKTMEEFGTKSPVEQAIQLLDASREGTNNRLAKDNLRLKRNANGTVVLENIETKEKQVFEIEVLEINEHPRFDGAYKLLGEVFNPEELDTKEAVGQQMQGLRYGQTIETGAKAVIFTLSKVVESDRENGEQIKKKEVVATLEGGLINLQDKKGEFTGDAVFMVFYVASKTDEDKEKDYRRYGFGRELMISAYQYSDQEAKKRNKKFMGVAGECTFTSRTFWEKMGLKRCYVQPKDTKSNEWKEIEYIQPPLGFDLETGEVEEGAGEAPEHFMAHVFEKGGEQDPEKIISIAKGFYETNNFISPKAFEGNTEAYNTHHEIVDTYLRDFRNQFENMKIRFLTEDEIKKENLAVEDYYPGGDEERKMLADKDAKAIEKREKNDNL